MWNVYRRKLTQICRLDMFLSVVLVAGSKTRKKEKK